jgi:hypothetical protein
VVGWCRPSTSPSLSVAELQTALASLGFADPSVAFAYERNEHAFDALGAALVARAVALNLTDRVRANSLSPQLRVGFTFPVLAAWQRLQALTSRPKLTDSLENLNSCVCTLAPALEEGSQRG